MNMRVCVIDVTEEPLQPCTVVKRTANPLKSVTVNVPIHTEFTVSFFSILFVSSKVIFAIVRFKSSRTAGTMEREEWRHWTTLNMMLIFVHHVRLKEQTKVL